MLLVLAQVVRLDRMRNGKIELAQTLGVDLEAAGLIREDLGRIHPWVPRELRCRGADELLLLQALIGHLRLNARNQRIVGLQSHIDPLGTGLIEVLSDADALCELAPQEHRIARIASLGRLDGRLLQHQVVVAGARDQVLALERHAGGQHIVGDLARIGHPDVVVHDQIHLRYDVEPALAVGLLMHRVAAGDEQRLIGAVRRFGFSEPVRHAHRVRLHGGQRALRKHDGSVVEVQREPLQLQAFDHTCAWTAELAGNDAQQMLQAVCLVRIVVTQAIAAANECLVGGRPVARHLLDQVRRNAGLLGDDVDRILGCLVHELLECGHHADALPFEMPGKRQVLARQLAALRRNSRKRVRVVVVDDEVAIGIARKHPIIVAHHIGGDGAAGQIRDVSQVVGQDVVDHAHGQIAVGSGLDAVELIGESCRAVEDEADVDDARSVLARLHQMLSETDLVLDGVAAPDVDEVGLVEHARIDQYMGSRGSDAVVLGIERAVVQADRLHRACESEHVAKALR